MATKQEDQLHDLELLGALTDGVQDANDEKDKPKMRVRFKDLDAAIATSMEMTRVLIAGVGGAGYRGVLQVAQALRDRGIKFGEPDVARRLVIDAMVVDGDLSSFDSKKRGTKLLREMGTNFVHLYVRGQREAAMQRGFRFSRLPKEADTTGCNADPAVGILRYSVARTLAARDANGMGQNPKAIAKEIIDRWMAPGQSLVAKQVKIRVLGSLAGGTGSGVMPLFYADLEEAAVDTLTSNEVDGGIIAMSAESFAGVNNGKQLQRTINNAVTEIIIAQQTIEGKVVFPDGEEIHRIPKTVTIVDGSSPLVKMSGPEGVYEPMTVAANAMIADICEEGGDGASLLSNLREGLLALDLGTSDGKGPVVPISRFSTTGTCSIVTDPHEVILRAQKQEAYFKARYGLNLLDAAQTKKIHATCEGVLSPEFDVSAKSSIPTPELTREELLMTGQEDNVPTRVRQVVSTFNAQLEGITDEVLPTMKKLLGELLKKMRNTASALLNNPDGGIKAELCFLEKLEADLALLEETARKEYQTLSGQIREEQGKPKGSFIVVRDQLVQNLENSKPLPGRLSFSSSRKSAIALLTRDVDDFIAQMNKISTTTKDKKVYEILLNAIRKIIKPELEKLLKAARLRENDAIEVSVGIKPEYDPSESGRTRVDARIHTNLNLTVDPVRLRKDGVNYDKDEMIKYVEGVEIKPDELDLIGTLAGAGTIIEATARRAHALYRPSDIQEVKQRGELRFITVPPDLMEKDPVTQLVTVKRINVPTGIKAVPVELSGQIVAGHEIHGINSFDRHYFRTEVFKQLMALPPEKRIESFPYPGAVEVAMPGFASYLAEKLAERHEGKIIQCPGCNLDVFQPAKSNVTCCEGCKPALQKAAKDAAGK